MSPFTALCFQNLVVGSMRAAAASFVPPGPAAGPGRRAALAALAGLVLSACRSVPSLSDGPVGFATLRPDGVIVMDLTAKIEDGDRAPAVGHARLLLKPGDPRYEPTLQHLGGLRPGETKALPPWPASEKVGR